MRVLQINQAQPQTTVQAVQNSQAGGSTLYSSSIEHPTTGYSVMSTPAFTRSTVLPAFNRTTGALSNLPPTQLPTPVNSDTPTEISERSSHRPKLKTLPTDSEDFDSPVHEIDEDDDEDDDEDEMIELAKRIEQSAGSKETSPPARAHKFNIRETHEYDNYGGALFTEEERELLGTSTYRDTHAATTNVRQTQSSSRKMLEDPSFAANSPCPSWTALPCPVCPTQALSAPASGSVKLSTPDVMLYATIGASSWSSTPASPALGEMKSPVENSISSYTISITTSRQSSTAPSSSGTKARFVTKTAGLSLMLQPLA
jgi:hypothetical protein